MQGSDKIKPMLYDNILANIFKNNNIGLTDFYNYNYIVCLSC